MSDWWNADPVARAPVRITVNPVSQNPNAAEGFTSNPRGFSTDDVGAAVRGDMFNSPGMPTKYAAQPGQTFGVDATRNAKPIDSIVAHHTGGPTLGGALNSARKGDPFTGAHNGYHFYIDTDGTVVQGAPMDARTNHVQPPSSPQRSGRPDISNSNAVGISFVGNSSNPTPEQLSAANNLSTSLMDRYGIKAENVVGHGEIQASRQGGEGMPLVNAIRNPQEPQVAQTGIQSGGVANAAPKGDWWAADPVATKGQVKDIGRGRAALEGIRSGVTANFGDELAGLSAASGLPGSVRGNPMLALPSLGAGAARLGLDYLTGGKEASGRYSAARDEIRNAAKASEEQYPGTYLAGNIAGAVAVPMGGMLNGATLPARIGRGAGVGAGVGALAGAGEGTTVEDRAARGLVGGALGGAVGGAGVPVVEGLARGVGAAISKPINIIRSAINPDAAAGRAVGRAYQDAIRTDPNAVGRIAPGELAQGGPQTVLDTLGGQGRDLARSAANLSGEARDTLNRTLNDRYEGQTGRLTNWLNTTFHFPNVEAQQQAIQNTARTVNRANYNRAFGDPAGHNLWDEGFQQLTAAPIVQDAIRQATRTGANKAAAEGFRPPQNPFQFAADGSMTMRPGVAPTLQFWDSVKRVLDDRIGAATRSGEREAARDAQQLRTYLVEHLDQLVPSYRNARQGAAGFFGADDALQAGQNFVAQNFAAHETRAALARMNPQERQLFQDGFVSRYIETINKTPDRADVVRRIYSSPAAREKIQLAIGAQRAGELEAMLRVEGIMQNGLRSVQGNSTTTQQLTQLGLAGAAGGAIGAGGGGVLGYDPTTAGVIGALTAAGKRGVDRRVAERVAQMLTSTDSHVLDRAITMIARSERMMAALRSADAASARVGGSQVPSAALPVQAPMVSRAQDEQPTVPRPPGQ